MKKMPVSRRSEGSSNGQPPVNKDFPIRYSDFIDNHIAMSGYANVDIAVKLGLTQQTMVSLIRRGKNKLPTDRVDGLAQILGIDQGNLMRRVLAEDYPHIYESLKKAGMDLLSVEEKALIAAVREANPASVSLPSSVIKEAANVVKLAAREIEKAAGDQPEKPRYNTNAAREARSKLPFFKG